MCECAALMLTQNRCEPNDLGMCGNKQIGIWEISKITVVDSNDTNRGNVDCTCHQPVIYDVTVNNCYL